jgi:hypothetical protein
MSVHGIARRANINGQGTPTTAPIRVDTVTNTPFYCGAGTGTTEKEIVDVSSTQTLTNKSITGQGVQQYGVLSLTGSVWHTGNGGANILSWPNPSAGSIVVTRVIIASTVVSSGAALVAAGTTTASKITAADNLIDDFDLTTTAPAIHDSLTATDTEVKSAILATGGWITFTASGDPTGFAGNAYISYFTV